MDAVAGFFGGDLAFDGHADGGEVADDVEDLVADEFVIEAKGRLIEEFELGVSFLLIRLFRLC